MTYQWVLMKTATSSFKLNLRALKAIGKVWASHCRSCSSKAPTASGIDWPRSNPSRTQRPSQQD